MFVSLLIALSYALFLFIDVDILGSSNNLIEANPLSTPSHILPEWYLNIFYAIPRSLPTKLLGVLMAALSFLLLFDFLGFYGRISILRHGNIL